MQNSLAMVGAGRVGRALAFRLRVLGWRIGAVVSRTKASAQRAVRFIGAGRACVGLTRLVLTSRIILIAVPDDQITTVAQELARICGEELRGKIVLHTSGAMDSAALDAVKQHGAKVGSMHPLQSFSGVTVPPLEGTTFAIEGESQAVGIARQIARAVGGSPIHIAGKKKTLYHAAAAMAAGHVLAVEEAATEMLISIGMKRREAVCALLALTRQVLENFERLGPRVAWTGPLSRGDLKVVRAHSSALHDSPKEFSQAYAALNHLAARVLSQDSASLLAELRKVSVEEKPKTKAAVTGGNA